MKVQSNDIVYIEAAITIDDYNYTEVVGYVVLVDSHICEVYIFDSSHTEYFYTNDIIVLF